MNWVKRDSVECDGGLAELKFANCISQYKLDRTSPERKMFANLEKL
nr:MAG TPA: hypothetical protein [Caudoviricetes sp.]